ncbi:hypothetical protein MGN70_010792 [Eutypa lata]|nr:hypothetical protein MGN70_010792 [Eutypa lata]
MLFISLIVAALFGALTAARGLKSPLEGYTVVPMSWNAVNTTDGSKIVLYGTIQELYEQLESLDDAKIGNGTNATSTATNEETRSLTPRSKDNTICWVGGNGSVKNGWLQEGINYLKQHTQGPCTAGRGPGNCARISCSFNTAIWLCNDDPEYEVSRRCPDIATYAEDIREKCTFGLSIQGQEFDTDGFNVMVGRDWC